MKKLKFYLAGLIPGLIIVFFVLNKKGASCSGYLPNGRVIAETLSKKFQYSAVMAEEMKALHMDEKFLRDSIITPGEINFDKSDAQKKPCPSYFLFSPAKNPKYELQFEKCVDSATFTNIRKL